MEKMFIREIRGVDIAKDEIIWRYDAFIGENKHICVGLETQDRLMAASLLNSALRDRGLDFRETRPLPLPGAHPSYILEASLVYDLCPQLPYPGLGWFTYKVNSIKEV